MTDMKNIYKVKDPVIITEKLLKDNGFTNISGYWVREKEDTVLSILLEPGRQAVEIKTPWSKLIFEDDCSPLMHVSEIENLLDICNGADIEFKQTKYE